MLLALRVSRGLGLRVLGLNKSTNSILRIQASFLKALLHSFLGCVSTLTPTGHRLLNPKT